MINGQTACGNLQLSVNRTILYFGQRGKKHYESGENLHSEEFHDLHF